MNRALLLANATALTVLLGTHFMPHAETLDVVYGAPVHTAPQHLAQLAVMSDDALTVNNQSAPATAELSQRLVF